MLGNSKEQKPVYVINGFLDSGKTSFFAYTLGQPYFQTKGRTLLILCEEGEEEYPSRLLGSSNTALEKIEDPDEFTPAALMALETKYDPERILIEWNGMWDFRNFRLPKKWRLEQQMTAINAETFAMYFTNMRSLLAEQLRTSELIMINRCDNIDEKTLMSYKRNIKAINQRAELVFENRTGEIDMTTEEDLPFDISQDPIELKGINYGIWYIDAMEHPDRYVGKRVKFKAMAMTPENMPAGCFVPGRMAMTCCAQDMQFLGYACRSDKELPVREGEWITLTARIAKENFPGYDAAGIVLNAEETTASEEPADAIIDFSGQSA
ncbi:MAG: GTPase [Lachnospiraceae bacterium]|nr:GTPase [Lachnospiraceae bacterium]